jgi:hypothetical protein
MLRYPMHGFAKRVDDSVARAMSFLRAKEMATAKQNPPASNPDVWQALARWREPAFIRWQQPSASRGIATTSRRPRASASVFKAHQEEGHLRI